jgi:hypothetical protein
MVKLIGLTKIRWQYAITTLLGVMAIGSISILLMDWQKDRSQSTCTPNPAKPLQSIITPMDLTERPKQSQPVKLDTNNPFAAYKISSSKSGQILNYTNKEYTCGWLYRGKDNQLVSIEKALETNTDYIFQVGMPLGKNSAQFSLSMWLASQPDIKNEPSPGKSNEPSPQASVGGKKVTPSQAPPSSPPSSFELSWKGIGVDAIVSIASSIAVMLFVGNKIKPITQYFRDFVQTRESKNLRLFWLGKNISKNEKYELPKYYIVYGSTSEPGTESRTSNEYSDAKDLIKKFLEKKIGCIVKPHRLLDDEVLDQNIFKDGNVILLTGEAHPIPGFDSFVEDIELPYFYMKDGQNSTKLFRRPNTSAGNQVEYRQASVMDRDNTISLAFATLTRLVDPDSDKIIIILNGGHGFGVSAPAYFLTSNDDPKSSSLRYLDFSKLNREVQSYQLVLEANNSDGKKKAESRDLHLSTWIRLEVTHKNLNSAITDLCQGPNVSQKKLDTRVSSPANYP